ncbi:MAG: RNA methyltransferase [Saprospiraceae bacterium]|nr:RNA methyltransferase [Saprospiraceae bacterium]
MLSRNQIKEIRSLKQKKFRQKYDKFVVEGHKTSIEFIKSGTFQIENIFALESWSDRYYDILGKRSDLLNTISEKEMARISLLTTPSDVLLVCKKPELEVKLPLKETSFAFYLDDIQDPGNLGTIIRICDWFGMINLYLSPETVDEYNPKVIQATRGSICNVSIIRNDLARLKSLLSCKIIGTDLHGIPLKTYHWSPGSLIILGNEGKGISDSIQPLLDDKVLISGANQKIAESLNVASAASILAYDVQKN